MSRHGLTRTFLTTNSKNGGYGARLVVKNLPKGSEPAQPAHFPQAGLNTNFNTGGYIFPVTSHQCGFLITLYMLKYPEQPRGLRGTAAFTCHAVVLSGRAEAPLMTRAGESNRDPPLGRGFRGRTQATSMRRNARANRARAPGPAHAVVYAPVAPAV